MQSLSLLLSAAPPDYPVTVKLSSQLPIRFSEETRHKIKERATQKKRSEAYIVREIVESHLTGDAPAALQETPPPYKTKKGKPSAP